jgi:hypothetical protein
VVKKIHTTVVSQGSVSGKIVYSQTYIQVSVDISGGIEDALWNTKVNFWVLTLL